MNRTARLAAGCAVVLLVAGCSPGSTRPPGEPTATVPTHPPSSSPSVSELPSRSEPAQPVGATGTLLGHAGGTGPASITVRPARIGTRLTVRMTCSGAGKVSVIDATGGLILATGGCRSGVVFSSGWTSTAHDGRLIGVRVAPGTSWAVEVWSGTVPDHSLTA
jgi:hypothetical protein